MENRVEREYKEKGLECFKYNVSAFNRKIL